MLKKSIYLYPKYLKLLPSSSQVQFPIAQAAWS